jgi:predicted site-specific integrase-resolvase
MLFNTKQAAEYLGLKPVTLEAWRVRGGSPVLLKLGKSVKYRQADLEKFIESRLRKNTSDIAGE